MGNWTSDLMMTMTTTSSSSPSHRRFRPSDDDDSVVAAVWNATDDEQIERFGTHAVHDGSSSDRVTSVVWHECVTRLDLVEWNDAAVSVSFLVLGLINVVVVVGNTLVIVAVFVSDKLRTVTNLFIVSLAVSDLLVGLAVLPFSTANEVLGFWMFGAIWCEVWLAVDVWMCTASILNLCAISLDRYVAVTRPVSYPNIMTPRRAKILIALVWTLSFVICFPPLVGWNDSRQQHQAHGFVSPPPPSPPPQSSSRSSSSREPRSRTAAPLAIASFVRDVSPGRDDDDDDVDSLDYVDSANATSLVTDDDGDVSTLDRFDFDLDVESNVSASPRHLDVHPKTEDDDAMTSSSSPPPRRLSNVSLLCQCRLISDKGYRIYSAIGSFYLPMFVMLFFYWRIYRAAVETTRAINQGFRTTTATTTSGGAANGIGGRFEEQRLTLRIHRGRSSNDLFSKTNGVESTDSSGIGRKVRNSSVKESSGTNGDGSGGGGGRLCRGSSGMTFPPSGERKAARSAAGGFHRGSRQHRSAGSGGGGGGGGGGGSSNGAGAIETTTTDTGKTDTRRRAFRRRCIKSGRRGAAAAAAVQSTSSSSCEVESMATVDGDVPVAFAKMGKRNIKAQVKRFRTETKAAKTLGIIVGGFIVCWLPFFTIYLVGAFCDDDYDRCIPESLFAVAFWLGYCNSAINPCVYALFSRDFRNAFKRILCRCIGRRRHDRSVKKRIVTMFPTAATFHLASFFEESEDGPLVAP